MKEKIGFTLGKYSPLHRGHRHVIETALAEMDRVFAVVYQSPETTAIPLEKRAGWIRKLYPEVDVIEAPDGPVETGDTPEIEKMQEDFLLRILKGVKITHFYSSESYGGHVARAFDAVDRQVDPERKAFPVSGTLVRKDPFGCRKWIHPSVYRDLVRNVVFMGAPCTGKTTICRELAEKFDTQWMPEYGREYWEKHQVNRRLSRRQLLQIAKGHVEREEKQLVRSNRYLFADTCAITTYMFSLYYHGAADSLLARMADRCSQRYDAFFLCEDDFPYVHTWDRSGEANRKMFQECIRMDLEKRKIPFVSLRGNVEKRVLKVKTVLEGLRPIFLRGAG